MNLNNLLLLLPFLFISIYALESLKSVCLNSNNIFIEKLPLLSKIIVPALEGKTKGDAGKIGVIGGSTEYTGAPFFAAQSSLKVGADLVYVVTTESAAPVIKTYSPDLIVYPFLNVNSASKISSLLQKMDVVIIGPGLGRESDTIKLISDIIQTCKSLKKPLIIDADGLYAVSKDGTIIKDYPSPGAILTPNTREAKRLLEAVGTNTSSWRNYWGDNVSILEKGERDQYHSATATYEWSSSQGGSGRRAGGQGDILAGVLGTFYNWALKNSLCEHEHHTQLAQSIAAYAAAKFTRISNSKAFAIHGRSMTASDMLKQIHEAFEETFL